MKITQPGLGARRDRGAEGEAPPDGRRSRRALITGATAAGAGLAASVLLRPDPAAAANGNDLVLGESNEASAVTVLTTSADAGLSVTTGDTSGSNGLYGLSGTDSSSGSGYGVEGISTNGVGVSGSSANGYGVTGFTSATDKAGVSGSPIGPGGTGVLGETNNGTAVKGQDGGSGTGVLGTSDSGPGVAAQSTTGVALQVTGKVTFSGSGLATVAAKKKSVTVTLAGVTTSSMILATLQQAAGAVAVASAVPGSGSFTVNLTAAPAAKVKVAYFVIG